MQSGYIHQLTQKLSLKPAFKRLNCHWYSSNLFSIERLDLPFVFVMPLRVKGVRYEAELRVCFWSRRHWEHSDWLSVFIKGLLNHSSLCIVLKAKSFWLHKKTECMWLFEALSKESSTLPSGVLYLKKILFSAEVSSEISQSLSTGSNSVSLSLRECYGFNWSSCNCFKVEPLGVK